MGAILDQALGGEFRPRLDHAGLVRVKTYLGAVRADLARLQAEPENSAKRKPETKEVPWSDDAPEYLPNSKAVKLADGDLDLKQLGRLLKPNGSIRYMRKGRRTKVHLQDFVNHLKAHEGHTITDEAVDAFVSGIEKRKLEEARRKRANL